MTHLHRWTHEESNAVGYYSKRNEFVSDPKTETKTEINWYVGDVKICGCGQRLFVPYGSGLAPVECETVKSNGVQVG